MSCVIQITSADNGGPFTCGRATPRLSLDSFLLAGDTRAQSWITTLLKDKLPAHSYGRALLVPGATPPRPVVSRGTLCLYLF